MTSLLVRESYSRTNFFLSKVQGTTESTVQEKRTRLSQKDFERWTQDRDLGNRSWRFNEKDGLYHPIY
jgi:hypothetical protein